LRRCAPRHPRVRSCGQDKSRPGAGSRQPDPLRLRRACQRARSAGRVLRRALEEIVEEEPGRRAPARRDEERNRPDPKREPAATGSIAGGGPSATMGAGTSRRSPQRTSRNQVALLWISATKPPVPDDDGRDDQNEDAVDDECSCPVNVHRATIDQGACVLSRESGGVWSYWRGPLGARQLLDHALARPLPLLKEDQEIGHLMPVRPLRRAAG
jgi:hypothetical protein